MDSNKIKQLRDATGLSFNEIRKALEEAGDDIDKAAEILKGQGALVADKKAYRQLKSGVIEAYIHSNKKLGCIMELLCETDFVARNEEFQSLAHDLAMHITAMKPANDEELYSQLYIKNPEQTIKDFVNQHIAKLGENIQVARFEVFSL